MEYLKNIIEGIRYDVETDEVQNKEEYILFELRKIFKDEKIIKEIKNEILGSI